MTDRFTLAPHAPAEIVAGNPDRPEGYIECWDANLQHDPVLAATLAEQLNRTAQMQDALRHAEHMIEVLRQYAAPTQQGRPLAVLGKIRAALPAQATPQQEAADAHDPR